MKYRAGFLKVACAWVVIMLPSSDAGHVPRKHAADFTCRPKELAALTKSLVETSLTRFDEANGNDLGTWPPGFPELKVDENSPLDGSKVQCSLLFMGQGLGKVLEDQRSNLNPGDFSLHKKLEDTISRINMLANCMKDILGGGCSPKPSPPKIPIHAFERKQWSHTLLKTARDYLDWLARKFQFPILKVKGTKNIRRKVTTPMHLKYLEGSGYLL